MNEHVGQKKFCSRSVHVLSSNVYIREEGRSSSQRQKVSNALNMYKTESVAKLDEVK